MDHPDNANSIASRLRQACHDIRRKAVPLADLIPLLQQAADALETNAAQHTHECRRCALHYTPTGVGEDCPSCGYDGDRP